MAIGKKGRGRHWTAAEVSARQAAAERLKRKGPKDLKPPAWLSPAARKVWDKKMQDVKGVDLLDILDEESLAIYCDAVANYEQLSRRKRKSLDVHKAAQAWARIAANYADRLGFTPTARARLIGKRAQKPAKDQFAQDFD